MSAECSIDGCAGSVSGRGWCRKHYLRWYRLGDPHAVTGRRVNTLDRYWPKVDRSGGPEACWPWQGYCDRYGIFWDGTNRPDGAPVMVKAHRWTYEQFIGPVPDGLHVCHTCDNPPCVNPAHLFVGTRSDNMRDMVSKGRNALPRLPIEKAARGEANAAAKLTTADVLKIRARYAAGGESQQAIADDFEVNQSLVSSIVRRKVWRHV